MSSAAISDLPHLEYEQLEATAATLTTLRALHPVGSSAFDRYTATLVDIHTIMRNAKDTE